MHIFTNEVNIYLHQLVVSVFKKKNLLQHFSTWELLVNAQFSMISQHCTVVLNAIVKGFMLSGNPWLIIITIKLINIPNLGYTSVVHLYCIVPVWCSSKNQKYWCALLMLISTVYNYILFKQMLNLWVVDIFW